VYWPKVSAGFHGELWSVSEQARDQYGTYWIRHANGEGFCAEPDSINGGGNSGYQAVHLSATFGARKIVLLGFDMQRTGGQAHWHGKHEGRLPNGVGFVNWMKAFRRLAADLKSMGVEVVNCSRETAMTHFRREELRKTL
jgi:predicted peroxiredoxin